MKLTKRTERRITAINMIYEMKMNDKTLEEIESSGFHENLDSESLEYVQGVSAKLEVIDEIIAKNLQNYSIGRLNRLDLAIIELAVYELLENKVPEAVIINEALNISKIYTQTEDFDSVKFNNRLLENIKNFINQNR